MKKRVGKKTRNTDGLLNRELALAIGWLANPSIII